MWREVEASRATGASVGRWRALALAATIGCALAAVGLAFWARGPGALLLEDGSSIPASLQASGTARLTTFSDESRVRLSPRSRLDAIESSERAVAFALRRGHASFSVMPHGPRRWRIDCGAVQVEVVGTVFTVDRSADAVSVSVQRGAVVVRGEGVADGVVRLHRGQRIRVAIASVPATSPIAPATDAQLEATTHGGAISPVRPLERARVREVASGAATGPGVTYRDALSRSEYAQAYAALGPGGVAGASRDARRADDLFDLADVARLSGHPTEARAPLSRIVERYASDPRAAMAAFTLGQLELGSLHDAASAATHLERSLSLGLPRSARETAMARLVEALARTGSPRATQAADAYLAAYPSGRYRDEVAQWGAH